MTGRELIMHGTAEEIGKRVYMILTGDIEDNVIDNNIETDRYTIGYDKGKKEGYMEGYKDAMEELKGYVLNRIKIKSV